MGSGPVFPRGLQDLPCSLEYMPTLYEQSQECAAEAKSALHPRGHKGLYGFSRGGRMRLPDLASHSPYSLWQRDLSQEMGSTMGGVVLSMPPLEKRQ